MPPASCAKAGEMSIGVVSRVAWIGAGPYFAPLPRQACRTQKMDQRLIELAQRIAEALERIAPPPAREPDLSAADAFVWHPEPPHLAPVPTVSRVDIALLKGI